MIEFVYRNQGRYSPTLKARIRNLLHTEEWMKERSLRGHFDPFDFCEFLIANLIINVRMYEEK